MRKKLIAHWSNAMKAYRSPQPSAWKRRFLVVSVVVTGVSAFIPWGEIKPGDEQKPGRRKSDAVPIAVQRDKAFFWDDERSAAAERLPPVALAAPFGGALQGVGKKPQEMQQARPPLERLETISPRKRSIAPKLATERGSAEISPRAYSTSFVEVADGVYQVVGAVAAANEPSGREMFQNQPGSQIDALDQPMALAAEGVPNANPSDISVVAAGLTSELAVAPNPDSSSSPGDVSRKSASADVLPEAVRNIAEAAEGLAVAPVLVSNEVGGSAPKNASLTPVSVDVPPEAKSVIRESASGPATAPMPASIAGSSASQDALVTSPDVEALTARSGSPGLTNPGIVSTGSAIAGLSLDAGRAEASAPQTSLPVRINEVWLGNVPFVIDSREQLSVSVAGLLDLVRPSMRHNTFKQLRSSRAASGYVGFDALRKAGFTVTFDRETKILVLSAHTADNAPD